MKKNSYFIVLIYLVFSSVSFADQKGGGGVIIVDNSSGKPVYVSISSHLNSRHLPVSSSKYVTDFDVLLTDLRKKINQLPIPTELKSHLISKTEIIPLDRDYYIYDKTTEDPQISLRSTSQLFNHYLCAQNYPSNFLDASYVLEIGAITMENKTYLSESFFALGSTSSPKEEKLQKVSLLFMETLRVVYPYVSTCILEDIQISFENYFRYDKKTNFTKVLEELALERGYSSHPSKDEYRAGFLKGLSKELTYYDQNMNIYCHSYDYFPEGNLKSRICKLSSFTRMLSSTEKSLFKNYPNYNYYDSKGKVASSNTYFRHYNIPGLRVFINYFDAAYAVLPKSIFQERYNQWFKGPARKLFLALDFSNRNNVVNDQIRYGRLMVNYHKQRGQKVKRSVYHSFAETNLYKSALNKVKLYNNEHTTYYAYWMRRKLDKSFNVIASFFTRYMEKLDPDYLDCIENPDNNTTLKRYSCISND